MKRNPKRMIETIQHCVLEEKNNPQEEVSERKRKEGNIPPQKEGNWVRE